MRFACLEFGQRNGTLRAQARARRALNASTLGISAESTAPTQSFRSSSGYVTEDTDGSISLTIEVLADGVTLPAAHKTRPRLLPMQHNHGLE